MPPRSAKKTVAKKPSARAKKQPSLSPALEPSLTEAKADASTAAVGANSGKEDIPAAGPDAVPMPINANPEEKAAISEFNRESEDEEKVSEEMKDEEVMEDADPVEVKADDGAIEIKEEEMKQEAVFVEEEVERFLEKVQDSIPVESEENPTIPENGDIEKDDGKNQIAVDEGKEDVSKEETLDYVTEVTNREEDIRDLDEGVTSQNDNDAGSDENEEDVESLYLDAPMSERKKHKEFEIFVGGLDKEAIDEDLIKIFGVFGEIDMVRIVRNPITQKSKGYAFVRYTSIEHAKKALIEMKDGIEIKGKRVGISATQDNDTLYLGNICKSWTKEKVSETLKEYGIEQIEHILLPDDSKNNGKIKGFAFIEFSSHPDAMVAFQRLRKPDAIFGMDISAKVAFAQSPMHPCEEVMLQVKTVYLENIPEFWQGSKLKELCHQYGEVQKVQLFRKTRTKRKDFAFVEFNSRESAIACIEGINNAQIGEGEVKVNANLARPVKNARIAKQGARGGFKVSNVVEVDKGVCELVKKQKGKSKELTRKEKPKLKPRELEKHKKIKFQGKGSKPNNVPQPTKTHKGKRSGAGRTNTDNDTRPSKKARRHKNYGNFHGTPAHILDNQRGIYSENPSISNVTRYTKYASMYPPSATAYQAHSYPGASSSAAHTSHFEPHAGYVSYGKQNPNPYGYDQRRFVAYDRQIIMSPGVVAAAQTSYHGPSNYAGYEARVSYPSSGVYSGASTHPPYIGGGTHAPYIGGGTHAPYIGGGTHAPSTAGSTHASYTAGSSHAPYAGSSAAYAPHGGYY